MTEHVEMCHRCHSRPGERRLYDPHNGRLRWSLAGAPAKLSMRETVGCDPCWDEFTAAMAVERDTETET